MNKEVMNTDAPIAFTNHFAWEAIADGAWAGHPCFIVGGGPSLSNFNWNLLKGKLTIGINRVYEKVDPTIIYGQDPKFVRWILMGKYGDHARMKFLDSSALKIWLNIRGEHLPGKIYILKCWRNYLEGRKAFPFTMKNGIGHGYNSGYGALNLAACLGANPIYLLGYDMKTKGTQAHWHGGHPRMVRSRCGLAAGTVGCPDHRHHWPGRSVRLDHRMGGVTNDSKNLPEVETSQ